MTILETRLDTILPTLATKEDIARLEGKMDASDERLEGKIDTMGYRMLIGFTSIAAAVAAARFL